MSEASSPVALVAAHGLRKSYLMGKRTLEVLRGILGGGLTSALREPAGALADELTELATEATEVHLDRRLRSVRSSPTE